MPEPESKSKPIRKSKTTRSKVNKNTSKLSRSKKKKPNPEDGITKSKQLAQKLQTCKSNKGNVLKSKNSNIEVRLCGNGKPMPSLAELEKMFEDSDSDGETNVKQQCKPGPTSSSTPKQSPEVPQEILTSPNTIKKIADRMLDLVSNLTESPIILEDDGPPPPVIKPKKRKKTEIPYIVGCKDRPYVPQREPNGSFCKGDDEYGVENNSEDEDDDIPKKRAKRTKKVNMSKSIFNAVSDEIAAGLKEQDDMSSDVSSDSNKTVAYEYYNSNGSNRVRSFSPLPSTSKDNDTFVKNDQLFNESLLSANMSTSNMDDDIEIIETPCKPIIINDTTPAIKSEIVNNSSVIEIIDDASVDTINNKDVEVIDINDDDCEQLVDVKPASPIPIDYYSNIKRSYNDEVYEVIDVDELIAKNAAILKKYSKKEDIGKVTSINIVDSETSAAKIVGQNMPADINVNDNVPQVHFSIKTILPIPSELSNTVRNITIDKTDDIIQIIEENLKIQRAIQRCRSGLDVLPNNLRIADQTNYGDQNFYRHDQTSQSVPIGDIISICANSQLPLQGQSRMKDARQRTPPINVTLSPRSTDSPDVGSKKLGDCPICMDTLSNKALASTLCGHIFCMSCIKLSIKSNGKKCPTCRKTLRGAGFHQIFL